MEIFTKDCADAYDRAAKTVGAYLGWYERMLEQFEKDIEASALGFWKRRTVKIALKKLKKLYHKQDKDFTTLIGELGKVWVNFSEEEFTEKCESVRRMMTPLFAKTKFSYQELNKLITIVKLTTKRKEA